jgi:hypothetical protein
MIDTETATGSEPMVGERPPDFELNTPGGGTLTLSDLRARRTLIIFQRHLG